MNAQANLAADIAKAETVRILASLPPTSDADGLRRERIAAQAVLQYANAQALRAEARHDLVAAVQYDATGDISTADRLKERAERKIFDAIRIEQN